MKNKIMLWIFAAFFILTGLVSATELNDSGMFTYHFNSSLADASGNGHGLSTGTGADYVDDQLNASNEALQIGTDKFDSSGSQTTFSNSFTAELVFKVDSSISDDNVILHTNGGGSIIRLWIDSDGTFNIYFRDDDNQVIFNDLDTNVTVANDLWHYVAISIADAGNDVIFIDDQVIVNHTNPAYDTFEVYHTVDNYAFGSLINNQDACEDCVISEFRTTEGVLNASHVHLMYDHILDYPNHFKIFAYDSATLGSIGSFGAIINGTGYNTTSGEIRTDILHSEGDLYDISVNSTGYNDYNVTNYNISSNIIAYMNLTNFVQFNFIDEETQEAITENITVDFISDSASYTGTTTDGNISFNMLIPENYTSRYSSENYTERLYFFELSPGSYENITLYGIKKTSLDNITITVYDEQNLPAEGVYISALRYYADENTYYVVEMVQTDFNGKAIIHLVKYDEFYKFYLYRPLETLLLTTTKSIIIEDDIRFQINTGEEVLTDWYQTESIVHSLSFSTTTDQFTFAYSDTNQIASSYCLSVYEVKTRADTLLNQTCLSSAAGSISIGVTPNNGTTYSARTHATVSGDNVPLESMNYKYPETTSFGNFGLFLAILLTILFAFVGIYNLTAMFIITPLPLSFAAWLGIVTMPVYLPIILIAAGLVAAFVIGRGN